MDNARISNMVLKLGIGQHKIHCPSIECQRRKKKNLRTLSVKVDKEGAIFFCHHCDLSGSEFYNKKHEVKNMSVVKKIDEKALTINGLEWLKNRGISEETAKIVGLKTVNNYIGSVGQETECIVFPYTNKGQVYASKIRSIKEKGFACNGSPQTFFNIENVDVDKPLIICEGEMDCCAFIEASVHDTNLANVISVPHGAVMKVVDEDINPETDNKFRFLWNAKDVLEKVEKIIIATDDDSAGKAMSEEMARRIGRHKCFKLKYPEDCKDANDIIIRKGTIALLETIATASPYPVSGLYDASHFYKNLDNIYENGFGRGEGTGYPNIDELYTIVKSQLTVVTGHPSSGKSEFIDQLMVNMAVNKNWKFAVASFENQPPIHMAKIISKFSKKPFFDGANPRVTKEELEKGKKFVENHFYFVHQADGSLSSITSLIDRMKTACLRYGINGVVIDPYNYIARPTDVKETDWVSDMLTQLRVFAQSYDVHVWLIAHPTKMMRDNSGKVPPPKGYDISGSSHLFSKTDNGITIHRPDPSNSNITEFHCWKCRYSWVGKQGEAILVYDAPTSTYGEFNPNKTFEQFFDDDEPPF